MNSEQKAEYLTLGIFALYAFILISHPLWS